MATYVTEDQKKAARKADLYGFLLLHHPKDVEKESKGSHGCIRLKENHSISIKYGYSGYYDFSTCEGGNGIDLLMRYFGYSFIEAVSALSQSLPIMSPDMQQTMENVSDSKYLDLPKPVLGRYRQLFAYLQGRGIPSDVIQKFIHAGLIYQTEKRNNIAFINREKDYLELRGTYTYGGKPFHGCMKSSPDRFWWFKRGKGKPVRAYVCEAAIDAISLYLIHLANVDSNLCDGAILYCSIGGVSNQKTIDRIARHVPNTIIAVDNDEAGAECRRRNADLEHIIPCGKDWNEDLQNAVEV